MTTKNKESSAAAELRITELEGHLKTTVMVIGMLAANLDESIRLAHKNETLSAQLRMTRDRADSALQQAAEREPKLVGDMASEVIALTRAHGTPAMRQQLEELETQSTRPKS